MSEHDEREWTLRASGSASIEVRCAPEIEGHRASTMAGGERIRVVAKGRLVSVEQERDELKTQLEECEEALGDERAEHEAWMERMLRPLADRERVSTGSVQSMPWDDLLAVAVRNVNATLDAEAELEKTREVLRVLVALKEAKTNNPQTEDQRRLAKEAAWESARAALAVEGERDG
jgi:hypothetical protein